MAAISRLLLGLSSMFGLVFGIGFLAVGIYGLANKDMVSKLAQNIDLSSMPQAEKMKSDVMAKIEALGIVETVSNVLITTGVIFIVVASFGLASAITAFKVILIIYIVGIVLLLLIFLVMLGILLAFESAIKKPLVNKMVASQNDQFVSIVSLAEGNAGDGAFITILMNFIQLQFRCCGWSTVGDIRDSPRWQASPRGLADLLKLNKAGADGGGGGGLMSDDPMSDGGRLLSDLPDWIRNRVPPGSTLPPGVNLPDKLPEGVRIPKDFNISMDILKDPNAIRKLFEESLVLHTPVTCCRLNKWSMDSLSMNTKDLVTLLVDPNCPFQAGNVGVNEETCFTATMKAVKSYTAVMIIVSIFAACMIACNLGLAVRILLC